MPVCLGGLGGLPLLAGITEKESLVAIHRYYLPIAPYRTIDLISEVSVVLHSLLSRFRICFSASFSGILCSETTRLILSSVLQIADLCKNQFFHRFILAETTIRITIFAIVYIYTLVCIFSIITFVHCHSAALTNVILPVTSIILLLGSVR